MKLKINTHRYAFLSAGLLIWVFSASASQELIDSDETDDDVVLETVSPPESTPNVSLLPRGNRMSDNLALSGLPPYLSGSVFQFGAYRPLTFAHVGGPIGLLRAGYGIADWLTVGLGKQIDAGFARTLFWGDIHLRLVSTERFSFSLASGYGHGIGDEIGKSRLRQSSAEVKFGRKAAQSFRIQAVVAGNNFEADHADSMNLARASFVFEFPVADDHFISVSLSPQWSQHQVEQTYYHYRGPAFEYSTNASDDRAIGIPLGVGYRYETERLALAAGFELGPTVNFYSYHTSGSYAYGYGGESFSVLGMVNAAASLAVKF